MEFFGFAKKEEKKIKKLPKKRLNGKQQKLIFINGF